MEKKTRKTYSEETYDLSNAHVHDVLKQRKDSGEPLVIYKGEDGALYSDNGQSLWRVVDWHCKKLQSIKLPNNLVAIGEYAFNYCWSIETIHIPSSVTEIGRSAFSFCMSLTTINIPEGVTVIRESTFFWCIALTDVSIPKSVRKIERFAFDGCKALKSIYIPNSVRTIGERVFHFCESLERIEIPKGTLKKFAKLLPDDQDKLVEININR